MAEVSVTDSPQFKVNSCRHGDNLREGSSKVGTISEKLDNLLGLVLDRFFAQEGFRLMSESV